MKSTWKKKAASLLLAMAVAVTVIPAVPAMAAENIDIEFRNVTDEPRWKALEGEAKVMVSAEGVSGSASIAQLMLSFVGDLKYKSILYLVGENNPPACMQYLPNAAHANIKKEMMPGFVATDEIDFSSGGTDLFVLTFAGEAGDSVTLKLDTADEFSYCKVDDVKYFPSEESEITVRSATDAIEGKTASVTIAMDGIRGFSAGGDTQWRDSKVTVSITNETTGDLISTNLNDLPKTQGGHRENTTPTTFTVTETVASDALYTVEVSGSGYVTWKQEHVSFDEPISLTNADFIPGDLDGDGEVTTEDKALFAQARADNSLVSGLKGDPDFNRDGYIDAIDEEVYAEIAEEATAPAKMSAPTVTGASKSITVKWTAPADGGSAITGYSIKYGTSASSLNQTVTAAANATQTTISNLADDTTYYVSIAAQNAAGTGAYSDAASAATAKASESEEDDDDEGSGGGGGGGGGAGGGGGGGASAGGSLGGGGGMSLGGGAATGANTANGETFADLGNHSWAKDAIYALKAKGIISGTSETTFSPANNIKRGDFILILTRMLGVDNEFTENFADVPQSSYYYNAIGSAKAAGIATGDGVNFMPESFITRQDLITLAYRAFLEAGYIEEAADASALDAFADKGAISGYAKNAMASMVSAGIIKGDAGNVNPGGNATRAEVAVMCSRMVDLMD